MRGNTSLRKEKIREGMEDGFVGFVVLVIHMNQTFRTMYISERMLLCFSDQSNCMQHLF